MAVLMWPNGLRLDEERANFGRGFIKEHFIKEGGKKGLTIVDIHSQSVQINVTVSDDTLELAERLLAVAASGDAVEPSKGKRVRFNPCLRQCLLTKLEEIQDNIPNFDFNISRIPQG